MPKKRTLNFPVAKKGKTVTKRKATVKRGSSENDIEINECTESKMPKLNDSSDYSSTIEEEMESILNVLNYSDGEQLRERDEQIETLRSHLDHCLKSKESVSVYICGHSGTGKTATIESLLSQADIQKKFTVVNVNCLDYSHNSANVFKEIVQKIGGNMKTAKTQRDSTDQMLKALSGIKKPLLLTLDNVQALKKKQTILYSLFELPSRFPDGKVALLSVGNVFTFVDEFLPRLRGSFFKKPVTIEFPVYNDQQLINILTRRLSKVNLKRIVIEPHAILLLGKKAASVNGDVKNALQLAKEVFQTSVSQNTTDGVCTIRPINVQLIVNDILGETQNLVRLERFTLDEKLIVCAILLLIKDKKLDRTKLNVQTVEDMYEKICKKWRIENRHSDKFTSILSSVQLSGIISVDGKIWNRSSKVTFNWDEDEVRRAFVDKPLFGGILSSDF